MKTRGLLAKLHGSSPLICVQEAEIALREYENTENEQALAWAERFVRKAGILIECRKLALMEKACQEEK